MFSKTLQVSLSVGIIAFAVGCGGGGGGDTEGGSEEAARDMVEETKSAILAVDATTVCRNSTASFQEAMINVTGIGDDEKGQPCESVLPDIIDQPGHFLEGLEAATVTSIEVADDGSQADVKFDAAFYSSDPADDHYQLGLIYTAGQWEINEYCELSGDSAGSCISGIE